MAEWIPPGGALNKRPGLPNRLSREPGRRLRPPGERTKDSKPRRATGSGKVSRRLGVPRSLAKTAAPKQNKTRRIAALSPNVKGWSLFSPDLHARHVLGKGLTRSQRS